MLGPCLTQESRRDERSTVAIVGEMMRTQLLARGGGETMFSVETLGTIEHTFVVSNLSMLSK